MTGRDEVREHLAHEIAHVSHLLPSQGPIGTFIHHNTLHGLQHLPFHDALAEGQRILGGRGYLSAETFRRHHASGRISGDDIDAALAEASADAERAPIARGTRDITVHEVRRAHLVHGVEPLDPSSLSFRHDEEGLLRRLRSDVPPAARAAIIAATAAELEASLADIGQGSSVADWLLVHTGVDVPAWVRDELERSPADPDEPVDARRIRAESRALETLAPRHFGTRGT
ncbi:MAG: putative inorganic carbon transporter subunit DabA, partial [Candidatus Limnocylindria bacterium]